VELLGLANARGETERVAVRLDLPARGGSAGDALGTPLAILYLHGFGSKQSGEKATYFRQRALEAGWAFCSFDFRGHGASEGSMRELTLTRNLEDASAVRALLAARGFGRVALFGSSMGAYTALWHAARQPAGVVASALLAPAVGMLGGLERWAGPGGLERWRRDGTIRYQSTLVETEIGWQLVEDLRAYPPAGLGAGYRTPTVIFQGQLDGTVDWHEVDDFVATLAPGVADLRLFPDGDHRLTDRLELLWSTAAELFARADSDYGLPANR
jgi:pimeloyl-ACP methyl ester carboxylesterase